MAADHDSLGVAASPQQGRWSRAHGQVRQGGLRTDAAGLSVAVGVIGAVFGVLARSAGLSVGEACLMSLLVFTGASQLSAVGILSAGGSAVAAAASAVLLAARNAFYGPVVAPWLAGDRLPGRLAAAQVVIDESAGLGAAQTDPARRRTAFLAAGIGIYVLWNLGTLVGALVGSGLGEDSISTFGLDAAFPAAFVALLIPHLRARSGRVATASGAIIAAVGVPLLPAGVPVLVASIGAAFGAVVAHHEGRR